MSRGDSVMQNRRRLDKELVPLKLILGMTSIFLAVSFIIGGTFNCPAFRLINQVFSELAATIYFLLVGGATIVGLYKHHKWFDYAINTINIVTWSFLTISVYFSVYPAIPVINAAYTVIALVSIWVYTRSNIRY